MTDADAKPAARAKRPTLKTISALSGLAVTTVSRALGDAPDISEGTKLRVRRIAAEVGYVPDRAGVRLRTGRTNVVALVLPTDEEVMNMTPRLISSIAGALDGTPYHLIVKPELPRQDPLDPVRYVVETRSADALILNRVSPEDPRVAFLRERGFPFATHGRTVWHDAHAWYDYDNRAFGRLAVARLAERGRRHALLVAPPREQAYAIDAIAGAREAAAERGLAVTVADVTSDDPRGAVAEGVGAHLARDKGIDALIATSPHAAMAAAAAVEAQGHVLGEGFDIFAKETFEILGLFRPGILRLAEDIDAAGRFLAAAAIAEIGRSKGAPMQALERPAGQGGDAP